MVYFKEGVTYQWVHKGEESLCVTADEVEEKLSQGWSSIRGEKVENETIELDALSNEEIRAYAKEMGIPNYWNAKIENLKKKLRSM